jgi:hypothetical protein
LIAGATTTAEVGGFFIGSRGSLSIESGAAVTTVGITATGGNATITGPDTLVDASTTASPLASLSVTNGTLRIESGAEVSLASGGTFDFTAGRLSVNGFSGDLINDGGILAPGPLSQQQGAGSTTIVGDYDQNNGVLEIEVGGELAISQYDLVSVTGTAFLGGDLLLALINDYVAGPDETFTVLGATSLVGQFDNVNPGQQLATIDGLGTFQVNYGFSSAYAA